MFARYQGIGDLLVLVDQILGVYCEHGWSLGLLEEYTCRCFGPGVLNQLVNLNCVSLIPDGDAKRRKVILVQAIDVLHPV